MEKLIRFQRKESDYVQLVKFSGTKSYDQFLEDSMVAERWYQEQLNNDVNGEVSEDSFIEKFMEFDWNIQYITEDFTFDF